MWCHGAVATLDPARGSSAVARLVVSLSGLEPGRESLDRAVGFAAELDARGVPLSQLYRPRGRGGTPRRDDPLVAWLHARRASGDAVVLHGYDHTPDPIGAWSSSPLPRVARRAEFADLPRHEAALRLTAARIAATSVGLGTDLFVPPRWLASTGTLDALREQGFAACADEAGVHDLRTGVVARARVLGFRATGDREGRRPAESWRCRVFLAEAARIARRGGLLRVAVRAKDLRRPARRAAALAAVDLALSLGAAAGTYRPEEAARAA